MAKKKAKKKTRDITLKVKIKGCDEVFNEELGPGVISMKTLSFPEDEIKEKGEFFTTNLR